MWTKLCYFAVKAGGTYTYHCNLIKGPLNRSQDFLPIEMLRFLDNVEVKVQLRISCWHCEWVWFGAVQRADVSGPPKVGKYVLPKRRQLISQLRDCGLYDRMVQCRLGCSIILVFSNKKMSHVALYCWYKPLILIF
jgi:hypothetical protein